MGISDRLSTSLEGRYRIERELGRGGMATVYLAEDARHRRKVAVKVLHPELSAVIGSERFLKEIELTASLQHPHILPLFDSGSADGLLYYVMPYVEGETLRSRLERETQLPVADAIRIATEVASALDYAHGHHVVHRDIKPENILLQSGSALVADFGIALAVQSAGGERMTQTGLSLGTPHYMAPEQAMGDRNVDQRADIYALGAVTYEMLVGQPPFTGPTAQSIIAKVMTEQPVPPSSQRKSVPEGAEHAIIKALEKLPADRWVSAQAFANALSSTETRTIPLAAAQSKKRASSVLPWAIAIATSLVAAWAFTRRPATEVAFPPSRLSIVVPGGTSFPGGSRLLDLSSDGSRIVYYSTPATGGVVMMQDLDALTATPIKGTEGGLDLHLSPDGGALYFGDPGQTKMSRVNLDGGAVTPIQGAPSSPFITTAPDGDMWLSSFAGGVIHVLPDGKVVKRFGGDTLPKSIAMQQMLPGGKEALVKELQNNDGVPYVMDLNTGKLTPVLDFPIAEVRYAAGYLVYVRNDGRLNAMPFDIKRRVALGAATQLAEDVSLSGSGIAQVAVASNGTIAYVPAQPRELVLVDRTGRAQPLTAEKRSFHQPRFSPDGKTILVDFPTVDGRDVWLLDRSGSTLTRVTSARDGHDGSWSPDGKWVLYASVKQGVYGVYRTRLGSGTSELIASSNKLAWPGRYMPDGKRILTIASDMTTNSGNDIVMIDSGKLTPIVATPAGELSTDISPDGRWLAYTSDVSGQNEVYVRSLNDAGDQVQVSQSGGVDPMWSHDGRELFFRAGGQGHVTLTTATLSTSPSLSVVSRKGLFGVDDYDGSQPHSNYDVSPDGQSFVMVRRGSVGRIVVLQNLDALVRKQRGAGKQ